MDEPTYSIPASVLDQVTSALNVAISVTMMKEPQFHQKMLDAGRALDDAINAADPDDDE